MRVRDRYLLRSKRKLRTSLVLDFMSSCELLRPIEKVLPDIVRKFFPRGKHFIMCIPGQFVTQFTRQLNKFIMKFSHERRRSDSEDPYPKVTYRKNSECIIDIDISSYLSTLEPGKLPPKEPDSSADRSIDSDSGISEPSPEKKSKKIQFSTAIVHEFYADSFEKECYQPEVKTEFPQLFEVHYFEIPSPQNPQLICRDSKRKGENFVQSTLNALGTIIPDDYSVPIDVKDLPQASSRAVHPEENYAHSGDSIHSDFSVNSSQIFSGSSDYFLPFDADKNPPKPSGGNSSNPTGLHNFQINNAESVMDEFGNSSYSRGVVEQFNIEKVVKQTHVKTSSSSLDTEDIETMPSLSRTSSSESNGNRKPIYTQITPKNYNKFKQIRPLHFSTPFSSPQSESSPDDLVEATNELLTKETKESLNLIHKTNWTLKPAEILKNCKCQVDKGQIQDPALDKKFVVNLFEGRGGSRRWEKISTDTHVDDKQLQDGIMEDIEMLERESKRLKYETKKIKNEIREKLCGENAKGLPPHLDSFINNITEESCSESVPDLLLEPSDPLDASYPLNPSDRTEPSQESPRSNDSGYDITNDEQNRIYKILKKARDIECSRMAQASKALKQIRSKRGKKDWLEVLVAEKVLLETSERVNLLTLEIRENSYSVIPEQPLHKGTVHLQDIQFPFAKCFQDNQTGDKHFTEFFLMTISHRSKIFISEFLTGEIDPLAFKHKYTFKDVAPDFEIKVKLFCLRLRTSSEFFWEKLACSGCCPTSRIIYEDLITHQYQEMTVFKTSFKLCAEVTLTNAQINETSTPFTTIIPQTFNKLEGIVEHNFKCEDVDMAVSLSGFLDVGTLIGETYFWERKWCVLKGPNLLIYNYPQDEDLGSSVEQINLKYCFGPIINKVENCSKKRCFQLRTGRPNNTNDQNSHMSTLRSKPNFTLRKFNFAARDRETYNRWIMVVGKLLESLRYFKKLVFVEEYDNWADTSIRLQLFNN